MLCYVGLRIFLLLLFPLAALANHVRQWKNFIKQRPNEQTNEMNDLAWFHKRLMATTKKQQQQRRQEKKIRRDSFFFRHLLFFLLLEMWRWHPLFFFFFRSRRFLICHRPILSRHDRGRTKKNDFEKMKKKTTSSSACRKFKKVASLGIENQFSFAFSAIFFTRDRKQERHKK